MATEKEIEDIINMLDAKTNQGVGRIKVSVDENQLEGSVKEENRFGRCDIDGNGCE